MFIFPGLFYVCLNRDAGWTCLRIAAAGLRQASQSLNPKRTVPCARKPRENARCGPLAGIFVLGIIVMVGSLALLALHVDDK